MAIKLVFDDVEDFKQLFNFFQIFEGDGVGMISEVEVPSDPLGEDLDDDEIFFDSHIEDSMFSEPIVVLTPNVEKILQYGKYRYDINHCYFKTEKGRSGRILISGNEALQMIQMLQEGLSIKQIYRKMIVDYGGFLHDKGTLKNTATISTVGTFVRMYNKMELNNAIRFYCNNSRVNEDPVKYVKFPNIEEEGLEVENLWL